MAAESFPLIDVDRLQVGMYVVLDMGWRNHPFLRSRFTIRTDEQLAQLRALGPRQVRYCPQRSTVEPVAEESAESVESDARSAELPAWISASARLAVEPETELQWQETSLKRVEDEYRQVAQRHQQIMKQVLTAPAEARLAAEQLGDTLCSAVADVYQPAVRLLSQRVGHQASGHEIGVAALALLLARDCGFSPEAMQELSLAALLHDIGKVRIPAFLHEDNGRLTGFERRTYRQHVALGVELTETMGLPAGVVRAIAEHHEYCDGSGFPAALTATQMAPAGRLLAIVNRYQSLVCPLHLESGLTPYQALQQMYGAERAHFDPEFLARFIRIMGVYPPGTLVELSDRRMAVVIASRPGASLSPRVQVINTPEDDQPSPAIDIGTEGELRVRCSLPPTQLSPRWAQRARQLARGAVYIEPQSAPEWNAWGVSENLQTLVF